MIEVNEEDYEIYSPLPEGLDFSKEEGLKISSSTIENAFIINPSGLQTSQYLLEEQKINQALYEKGITKASQMAGSDFWDGEAFVIPKPVVIDGSLTTTGSVTTGQTSSIKTGNIMATYVQANTIDAISGFSGNINDTKVGIASFIIDGKINSDLYDKGIIKASQMTDDFWDVERFEIPKNVKMNDLSCSNIVTGNSDYISTGIITCTSVSANTVSASSGLSGNIDSTRVGNISLIVDNKINPALYDKDTVLSSQITWDSDIKLPNGKGITLKSGNNLYQTEILGGYFVTSTIDTTPVTTFKITPDTNYIQIRDIPVFINNKINPALYDSGTGGITKASEMTGDFWDADLTIPTALIINTMLHVIGPVTINGETKISTLLCNYGNIEELHFTTTSGNIINTRGLTVQTSATINNLTASNDLTITGLITVNDTQLLVDDMINEELYHKGITKASQITGNFWNADLVIPSNKQIVAKGTTFDAYYNGSGITYHTAGSSKVVASYGIYGTGSTDAWVGPHVSGLSKYLKWSSAGIYYHSDGSEDKFLFVDNKINSDLYDAGTGGITKASQMTGDFWDSYIVANSPYGFISAGDNDYTYVRLDSNYGLVQYKGNSSTTKKYTVFNSTNLSIDSVDCWDSTTRKFKPAVIPNTTLLENVNYQFNDDNGTALLKEIPKGYEVPKTIQKGDRIYEVIVKGGQE